MAKLTKKHLGNNIKSLSPAAQKKIWLEIREKSAFGTPMWYEDYRKEDEKEVKK